MSGRHVELYPHNEAAYRSITQGFKQHHIGAVVQATGTGKSYLLARYIASPSVTQRIRREHLFSGTGFLSDIRLRIEEILAELEPWQIMYERLIEFRREENDWPSVTEGKLGLWCNTQRIAYKRGKLQEERRRQLESIGFEWNQLDSKWMKEFRALKFFLDTCGR